MYQFIFILFFYFANGFRIFDVDGIKTIFALDNEYINIQCKSETPMGYCGFIHPSGKRFSFTDSSLNAGHCQIKIKASEKDSGEWRCHIGGKNTGVEETQVINVKVVKDVAAVRNNISTVYGKEVTIACRTVREMMPIKYCRFEPPNGEPFSIDSEITVDNAILDRYYFPGNLSLDRGDCAVTIHRVKYEDVGAWTCGAGLDDGKEHIDTITLDVEGFYTLSTATVTGISLTAMVTIISLIIIILILILKMRYNQKKNKDGLEYLMYGNVCDESKRGSQHTSPIIP